MFINGEKIKLEEQITFFGVRFDKFLTFRHQIKYIKDTCKKRINALKVIKFGNWKLNDNVLVNLYKTLVRSVIDYSLFFFCILSIQAKAELQTIQNDCIRLIKNVKLVDKITIEKLHEMAGLETLEERATFLLNSYISKARASNNELTCKLINVFERSLVEQKDCVKNTLLSNLDSNQIIESFDDLCDLFRENLNLNY